MLHRGSDHVFIYALFRGLLKALAAAVAGSRPRPEPTRTREQDGSPLSLGHHPVSPGYPESLSATLEPEAEAYLAWLADHHWPADEYLELERHWRMELGQDVDEDAGHADDHSRCPACLEPGYDVWPCRTCARLLHASCGHGMRRRQVAEPYRTRDMDSEAVIAEWVCTNCSSVVALDVDSPSAESDD
jgi:hypothetical protein